MVNKKGVVKTVITTEDLMGSSLDEMLTRSYGPKGDSAREAAEARIKAIAQNLSTSNSLKEIRERKKKSQHEVATSMNVDDSVVSKLEKNFEKAQIDTIVRYAKALKVKSVDIVFEFANKDKQILHLSI